MRLDVWLENSSGRKNIYSGNLPSAEPLRYSATDIDLGTGSGLGGENLVTAEISVSGMDDDTSDNKASGSFVMEGTGSPVENHHFSPNPIDRAFSQATFCVNTTEEIQFTLELYTLEGDLLGTGKMGAGYGTPVPVGLSCPSCGDLFPGIQKLSSGIYLYRLIVFSADGSSSELRGRFAVER